MEESKKQAILLFILAILAVTFLVFVYLIFKNKNQPEPFENNPPPVISEDEEKIVPLTREQATQRYDGTYEDNNKTAKADDSSDLVENEEKIVPITKEQAEKKYDQETLSEEESVKPLSPVDAKKLYGD